MAIVVKNTNYNGEVLEQILTLAATGNEIVEKGLIMVIPGVEKKSACRALKAARCCRNVRNTRASRIPRGISTIRRNPLTRWTSWPLPCSIPALRADLAQVAAQGQPRVRRTAP